MAICVSGYLSKSCRMVTAQGKGGNFALTQEKIWRDGGKYFDCDY